jgi:hypothetical protein
LALAEQKLRRNLAAEPVRFKGAKNAQSLTTTAKQNRVAGGKVSA